MASAASLKFLKQHPDQKEMKAVIENLKSHGQQGAAIIGVAYIEYALEQLLISMFIPMSKENKERLFDGSKGGILGGLNAKIRISYAIGIFGKEMFDDLSLVNSIRNVFAHSLHKVDFDKPELAKDVGRLKAINIFNNSDGTPTTFTNTFDTFVWNVAALHGILLAMMNKLGFKIRIDHMTIE